MIPTVRGNERGIVLITMAIAAIAIFAVLGLAVDLGRAFIAKSETQAFCDAAALTAASLLDGTNAGITDAQDAVASSANTWNLGSTKISATSTNYTLEFSTAKTGPWDSSPGSAANVIYARVKATVPLSLYFIPAVVAQNTLSVASMAVAGQIKQTSVTRGLSPYTAVSTNTTDPDYGFVKGSQYTLQWPSYKSAGCTTVHPDNCFQQSPCAGDAMSSKAAVAQYWVGTSVNGYWGSNSNSSIVQEVVDAIQMEPVALNSQLDMTPGNKASQANALDVRVNEDNDLSDNTYASYIANSLHNGRRIFGVPVVTPDSSGALVIGYAAFLLISNGNPSNYYKNLNGNAPFCGIYVGGFSQGSGGPGGAGGGYFKLRLVQ